MLLEGIGSVIGHWMSGKQVPETSFTTTATSNLFYGTQNIPQGVQTLPSELDWNISAPIRTHTSSSIQHTHPSHEQTPPLLFSHCPHSCHFSRQSTIFHSSSSIHSCTLQSTPPPPPLHASLHSSTEACQTSEEAAYGA